METINFREKSLCTYLKSIKNALKIIFTFDSSSNSFRGRVRESSENVRARTRSGPIFGHISETIQVTELQISPDCSIFYALQKR